MPANVLKRETMPIRSELDIVNVRQAVRRWAQELGFGLVDQTKLVTAASELARNALGHGGGGDATLEALGDGPRRGLRVAFADQGPGIADIALAMRDGFSTGGGMGLGLPGSKRLVDEFHIDSRQGQGTRVTIARWR